MLSKKVVNHYAGTEQFYSTGRCQLTLPAGSYKLTVYKGFEYRLHTQEVQVPAGQTTDLTVKLVRWINLPKESWYSAESHLHIARPFPELNALICKWMQAEDIHMANLLQWGNSRRFHNTTQYGHGPAGLYHEGDYWLATGQENPRTHFLGHTLTLGASQPINFPDGYLTYKNFWEEARRQKALAGFCHFATTRGAQEGIAIDLLDNLLSMMEVLQFDEGSYDVWYDTLNLGFRLTPIAGTDYPCGPYLPGRERFYAQVEGPLTYSSWLEGVRRGRTFVTNGPLLGFQVGGQGPGGEVALKKPGRLTIEGWVRFDPQRDDVERLELVENGQVVRRFVRAGQAAEIRCRFDHELTESGWLALRAAGVKRHEARSPYSKKHPRWKPVSPALAHSAAVFVTVANAPALSAQRRAKSIALAWAERLEGLEKRLAPESVAQLAQWPASDGVDAAYLRRSREALLQRVQAARKRFLELAR